MASQEALRSLWLEGKGGGLCGREQAKAWALREVWRSEEKGKHGMITFVASRLVKMKDGAPRGGAPTVNAVKEFFEKIDEDPDWFPGEHCGKPRGPKRLLTGVRVTAIQSAAKRIKAEDDEVAEHLAVDVAPTADKQVATHDGRGVMRSGTGSGAVCGNFLCGQVGRIHKHHVRAEPAWRAPSEEDDRACHQRCRMRVALERCE